MYDSLKDKRRTEITPEHLVDIWLSYYFNTTLQEESKKYDKDEDGLFLSAENHKFYNEHALTKEQYAEWDKATRDFLCTKFKVAKKRYNREFGMASLNYAPSEIKNE